MESTKTSLSWPDFIGFTTKVIHSITSLANSGGDYSGAGPDFLESQVSVLADLKLHLELLRHDSESGIDWQSIFPLEMIQQSRAVFMTLAPVLDAMYQAVGEGIELDEDGTEHLERLSQLVGVYLKFFHLAVDFQGMYLSKESDEERTSVLDMSLLPAVKQHLIELSEALERFKSESELENDDPIGRLRRSSLTALQKYQDVSKSFYEGILPQDCEKKAVLLDVKELSKGEGEEKLSPVPIPKTRHSSRLRITPDGKTLALFACQNLRIVGLPKVKILFVVSPELLDHGVKYASFEISPLTWAPDGTLLATLEEKRLVVVVYIPGGKVH
ncbi:hypothetical protein MKZ38_005445 [Zalerion maritima]|uniref:Uncharacterized protein n=1 Tax=Zalerion maritima TaxID=339359 RepID=A0AAD5WQZ5_9PEZI|nr:hypothetical protein MKZ38_005445 [Zalerion maritima]